MVRLLLLALSEKAPEVVKPKSRAGSKKPPAKVCPAPKYYLPFYSRKDLSKSDAAFPFAFQQERPALVLNDEDDSDDEVLELKERLAAYNLDSSPDQSAGKLQDHMVLLCMVWFIPQLAPILQKNKTVVDHVGMFFAK